MSSIDILIVVVVALFVWKGIRFGLIESIGGIVGLFIGAYMAGRYFEQVAETLESFLFHSTSFAKIIAFILVFILVNRAVALIFWIVDKAFGLIAIIPFLKTFNHLLGGLFGLLEGLLFIAIIVFFLAKAPFGSSLATNVEKSRFAGFVKTASVIVKPFMPASIENWSFDMPNLPVNLPKSLKDIPLK